jgi:hypothetical protein
LCVLGIFYWTIIKKNKIKLWKIPQ